MPRRVSVGASADVPADRPPDEFTLSSSERTSEVWRRLAKEMNKRLQSKREENDGPLDTAQTATVRGHIECLKSLLALGDDPPTFQE